jgi:putative heme-binding domain-containing protein
MNRQDAKNAENRLASSWRLGGSILCTLLLPSFALAQRDAVVPDPDPEIERRTFIVDPRFEVNLFAADPLLAKPIQMNWDAAGRLWVVSSEVYPQIKPGQKANDKIIILEDTKGVGRADKATVFADGLLIPTGLEPGDGGVYVANSTDLVHLSDTDGDGKADRRRIVLSGFGTEDTHHMLHTLRWGPDGMLYMNQSIYIHSHIETPQGPRRLNAGGIWRFDPRTMKLDVFARGWVNPWGHAFDKYGNSFVTDGAGTEGINYVIPGGYYVTAADAKRVFPGLNPGSPKYCGLEVTSGRHLPDDWQGNLLTNDFRGHRVCRFVLKDDGAGFAAIEQPELIKSNHPAFRPIDVKMGPDGAIYIADWYNPIIQHGEVDFRDPRRDVTHGRIWRVTAKGRPLVPRPKLVNATTAELLEALKAPEDWTRHFAKRVFMERGKDEITKILKEPRDDRNLDLRTIEIFLLELFQLGLAIRPQLTDEEYLELRTKQDTALYIAQFAFSREPNLRPVYFRFLRVIAENRCFTDEEFKPYWDYAKTSSLKVKLEAVRFLGQTRNAQAVVAALQVLDQPTDRFLDYALWLTVRELESVWLPAFREGKLKFDDPKALLFAVQASGSPQLVEPLLKLLQEGNLPADVADALWTTIAQLGGPEELKLVWYQSLDQALSPEQRLKRLQALLFAAKTRNLKPAGELTHLTHLLNSTDAKTVQIALRLAGAWKQTYQLPTILRYTEQPGDIPATRLAAVEGLAALGGTEIPYHLELIAKHNSELMVRHAALQELCRLDVKYGAAVLMDPNVPVPPLTQVLPALLTQKGGPEALTAVLSKRVLPPDVARVGQRLARSTGKPHQPLIDAFAKAGNLTTAKWTATPELVKELVTLAKSQGDPARGEAVYRRKELNCLKCHAIGGSGGQVGPDLTSLGASAQPDYLVEALLDPNKTIKENYHTTVVSTHAGKILTGVKQLENNQELVLRDAEDQEVHIAIKDIDERSQGKSLMPEGLVDGLTKAELADLVRFLSELGKVGPYAVGTARVARTWQVLAPTKPAFDAVHRDSIAAVVMKKDLLWSSEYTTVSGVLPLDVMADIYVRKGQFAGVETQTGFARTTLEVGTGGEVCLVMNDSKGINAWVGQTPVEVARELKIKLAPGKHQLTFAVDKKGRSEGLRVELRDVPGSSAQARWVLGR